MTKFPCGNAMPYATVPQPASSTSVHVESSCPKGTSPNECPIAGNIPAHLGTRTCRRDRGLWARRDHAQNRGSCRRALGAGPHEASRLVLPGQADALSGLARNRRSARQQPCRPSCLLTRTRPCCCLKGPLTNSRCRTLADPAPLPPAKLLHSPSIGSEDGACPVDSRLVSATTSLADDIRNSDETPLPIRLLRFGCLSALLRRMWERSSGSIDFEHQQFHRAV